MPEPEQAERTVTATVSTTSPSLVAWVYRLFADEIADHLDDAAVTAHSLAVDTARPNPALAGYADAIAERVAAHLEARPRSEAEAKLDLVRKEIEGAKEFGHWIDPRVLEVALDGPPAEAGTARYIYRTADGRYVAADGSGWLPGSYATREEAERGGADE